MRPTSAPQYKYKMEYLTKNQTKGSIVLVAHDENEAQRRLFKVCVLADQITAIELLREVK